MKRKSFSTESTIIYLSNHYAMGGNSLSPFEDLFDAHGLKTIQETIYELVKVAMSTDNVYFSKPEDREFLFYLEELLQDCIRKGYYLYISDQQ